MIVHPGHQVSRSFEPLELFTNANLKGSKASKVLAYPDGEVSLAANAQLIPKVAMCGTNFLVVWADNRSSASNGWDILGVRLDARGALLDNSAIPICTATNHQTEPAVAAQGTNFLVVWSDLRNTTSNVTASDIYGALVDPAGAVSPPDGFPVCVSSNGQTRPAVTVLGNGYLVAWQDARASLTNVARSDIFGARITFQGTVHDSFVVVGQERGQSETVLNVDVKILAQEPLLAPYLEPMGAAIAGVLGLDRDRVSVKAKSTDHLGALGRGESIAALATALVHKESTARP